MSGGFVLRLLGAAIIVGVVHVTVEVVCLYPNAAAGVLTGVAISRFYKWVKKLE